MRSVFAIAVLVAVLIAGCVAYPCTKGPLVSARAVSPIAPTSGGPGDATLDVLVKDPAGRAVPRAGVVLYWSTETPSDVRDQSARAEAGAEGAQVEVGHSAGTIHARTFLSLRTNSVGIASANVPSGLILGLVAAEESHTEEWIGYFGSPAAGEHGQVGITLYPADLDWTVNTTLSPAALSEAFVFGDSYYWLPSALPIDGDPSGHMARIVELDGSANWTNTVTGFGDLGIGIGDSNQLRMIGDRSNNISPGDESENVQAIDSRVRDYGFPAASGLQAGPVTKSSFVAPFGLPVVVHVHAHFDRARADMDNCLYVFKGNEHDNANAGNGAGVGDQSDGSGSSDPVVIPQQAPYARASPAAGILVGVALLGFAAFSRRNKLA